MTETGPSDVGASSAALGRPLGAEALPPAVAKLLGSATPAKLMAARGITPLKPDQLFVAIYQLSFDSDAGVRAAADGAPAALPDKILAPPLGEPLPAPVLHFFAERLALDRTAAIEKILYNPATSDDTFVALAGRLPERQLEIVVANEMRVLRCPAILEALFGNREARMSSVNRLVELCARNGVKAEGIPGFDEIAKSIMSDADATTSDADAAFGAALAASDRGELPPVDEPAAIAPLADAAAPPSPDGPAGSPRPAAAKKEPSGGGAKSIDFSRLKMHEKVRLATLGNEQCRQVLVRDPNRVVAMAAIRSPRISDAEIVRTAGSRQVIEDVIRHIGNSKDLVKQYSVRLALTMNPKCPLALSLRFLASLNAEDIKNVSRSKNVPGALAAAARRLVVQRGSKQP